MKNRKLIILLVTVAGIWSTIGFKIYQSMTDEPETFREVKRRPMSDSIPKEVYALSLQYADPFLKRNKVPQNKPLEKKIIQAAKTIVVVPQIMIDWSKVQYLGMLHNASRKITTATIKVGDNEYFVKEGGLAEGFIVSEIRSDSAKFSFQNQSKYLKRIKQ